MRGTITAITVILTGGVTTISFSSVVTADVFMTTDLIAATILAAAESNHSSVADRVLGA
jgi:hypothetical protein